MSKLKINAIVLAGGKGTRLKPYTTIVPKPLMPVGDRAILDIVLGSLKKNGFENVMISTGYLAELIQAYCLTGENHGLNIEYCKEDKPLGTAGAISLVLDQLEDNFLIINGDVLTTMNLRKMYEHHILQEASATIGIFPRTQKVDFGVIVSDENGNYKDYIEKPEYNYEVSMGVNILNKSAVSSILNENSKIDLPDLIKALAKNGKKILCYKEENVYWLDIGRIDDYQKANDEYESIKTLL